MGASEKQKPRWYWSGVMPLDGMEDDSRLRELVAMLPARKSSDREILTYLVDLRARFPQVDASGRVSRSRSRRTDGSASCLDEILPRFTKHLVQRSSTFKAPLDATLYERGTIRIVWFWRPYMRRPGTSRRSGAAMGHLTATLSGSHNCKIAFMS